MQIYCAEFKNFYQEQSSFHNNFLSHDLSPRQTHAGPSELPQVHRADQQGRGNNQRCAQTVETHRTTSEKGNADCIS